jgi:DNA-directed RNA polymerase subunit RPC12/RpoP
MLLQLFMPLRFECPHCSSRLSAGRELFHTILDCPDCGKEFMVPTPEDIKLPTHTLKFICPHCRRKLSATPEQFGTEMPCPFVNCGKPIQVPEPDWKSIGGGE